MSGRRENQEPPPTDPEALAKALELELMQKRLEWQKARGRRGAWRALSLLFLLLVILAALAAFFLVLPHLRSHEEEAPAAERAR